MTNRPSDHLAREQALKPDQSFIVQAPAGSGKTGLLVYRILRLLETVEQPEQVLAITFTRKATMEMRHRLMELLDKAELDVNTEDGFEQQGIDIAKRVLKRDAEKNWNLRQLPDRLQIHTIDAFCGRLVSQMPWVSRLGGLPKVSEYPQQLYTQAVEELLAELLADDSQLKTALIDVLGQLDFNYPAARQMFSSMLQKRDQWLRHVLAQDFDELREFFEQTWASLANARMDELRLSLSVEQMAETLTLMEYAASGAEKEKDRELLKPFRNLDQDVHNCSLDLPKWRAIAHLFIKADGDFRKKGGLNKNIGFPNTTPEMLAMKARMADLLESFEGDQIIADLLNDIKTLPDPEFSDMAWQHMQSLVEVLKSLAGILQLVFRRHNQSDYSEISQRANLALAASNSQGEVEATELAMKLDHEIRHILVDEFQDTSYSQIELLKKLTSAWDAHETTSNQGNTLFLVGDPMQSIYRFREAEVGLFLRVFGELESAEPKNEFNAVFDNLRLQALKLSENFRSDSALVHDFNALFAASFPAESDLLKGTISYSPATSDSAMSDSKKTSSQEEQGKRYSRIETNFHSDSKSEAQSVAQSCVEFLSRHTVTSTENLKDKDKLAILVRSRKTLTPIIAELNRLDIKFTGLDLIPLDKAQHVIDVLNLAKALYRPVDRVAWFALLRGPWCGLSLKQLQWLLDQNSKDAQNPLTVSELLFAIDSNKLSNHADGISLERLAKVKQVLQSALAQRYSVPVAQLVRWCWENLGGNRVLNADQLHDIDQVFELIEQYNVAGDLPEFVSLENSISQLYSSSSKASDSQIVLSTIHKAKGLEYHTVLLPALARKGSNIDKQILMWLESPSEYGGADLLLAPYLSKSEEPNNYHYEFLKRAEKARQHNELTRLMYVACTRARSKLVLSCSGKVNLEKQALPKPIKGSILIHFWNTLEDSFSQSSLADLLANSEANDTSPEQESDAQNILTRIIEPEMSFPASIEWQPRYQIDLEDKSDDRASDEPEIEYDWAGSVSKAVGIVFHDWLQFADNPVAQAPEMLDKNDYWAAALRNAGLSDTRLKFALSRIRQGLENLRASSDAQFIFSNHEQARNEYALSAYENGQVNRYRIDRTFVHDSKRWIIDYKTTITDQEDLQAFVDAQIADRHQKQLNRYGELMSQLDSTPIELGVYFPMLNQFRHWTFPSSNS